MEIERAAQSYELYHDESARNGYWHGMLLVPGRQKEALVSYLDAARAEVGYPHKISFKKINRPGAKRDLAEAWLSIALGFMRSESKHIRYFYSTGARGEQDKAYQLLDDQALGAKFILFRERDNHENMLHYPDETSKVETSFRFGFKGGLHYLFSSYNPVCITKIHFDGYLHQGRHIDRQRVVARLSGMRDYCEIGSQPDLIDDRASDPNAQDAQPYVDCQLLQLTDLLIGSFRAAFGYYSNQSQWLLARYARSLIDKYKQGAPRMRKSRWNRAFCMSQCHLEGSGWQFETISLMEDEGVSQLPLLD
ncbi:MAG: hypothetical protein AAGU04_07955 [Anaerolineaceae bacterium]